MQGVLLPVTVNGYVLCANKVILVGYNDLATTHPNLVEEWNFDKNVETAPTQVSAGSSKTIWWKCKNNHSWKATIGDRVRGNGCPDCSKKKYIKATLVGGTLIPAREISGSRVIEGYNDLKTLYPSLMPEWHILYLLIYPCQSSRYGRRKQLQYQKACS